MNLALPKLNYGFDALEPYIDAPTMELHYTKHHQTYLDKFKAVVDKYPDLQSMSAEKIISNLNELKVSESDRLSLKNFGGGFVNHNLYWEIMDPQNTKDTTLNAALVKQFGSLEDFKKQFNQVANLHFGSGWVWLVKNSTDQLLVYSLINQDSPLTLGHTPLLTLDLWEHAYYLKYQNRRAEYIENWWQVVKMI